MWPNSNTMWLDMSNQNIWTWSTLATIVMQSSKQKEVIKTIWDIIILTNIMQIYNKLQNSILFVLTLFESVLVSWALISKVIEPGIILLSVDMKI